MAYIKCLEQYTQNSQDSITRKHTNQLKYGGKKPEHKLRQGRYTNGKLTYENVLNVTCHQKKKRDAGSTMSNCVTPWAVVHQTSLSMEFSRQEYWSGLPFPTPGDLPDPRIEPTYFTSPVLVGRFFTNVPLRNGKSQFNIEEE